MHALENVVARFHIIFRQKQIVLSLHPRYIPFEALPEPDPNLCKCYMQGLRRGVCWGNCDPYETRLNQDRNHAMSVTTKVSAIIVTYICKNGCVQFLPDTATYLSTLLD